MLTMDKRPLPLALAALAFVPVGTLAETGPTLYGRANLSLEHQDRGHTWKLQSNASRVGIKGELNLDFDALKAIYRAEFEVFFDDGDSDGRTFGQRDIYAGLEHEALGMLIAGRFNTPLKKAQSDIDRFNNLRADLGNLMTGENRASNIIQYSTPTTSAGLKLHLAFVIDEDEDNARDNGISSSVTFENDRFFASIAYDRDILSSCRRGKSRPGQFAPLPWQK